jgi:hypothetical protein
LKEIEEMSRLRLVADNLAGPDAMGILVPPGARTVLIVRPRALEWDLLLVNGLAGTSFRELSRAEAPAVARSLFSALEHWSDGGPGHVGAVPASDGSGQIVWVDVDDFSLVLCGRLPGKPYQPLVFPHPEAARHAVDRVADTLRPPAGAEQEVYFNTRHFVR